jgi:hypothetical protein
MTGKRWGGMDGRATGTVSGTMGRHTGGHTTPRGR